MTTHLLATLRSAATFRIAIIIAITVAVVGFLLIHNVNITPWAITHGEIYLTDACWKPPGLFDDIPPVPFWSVCHKIPYKGVLVFCVLLVAIAAILRYSRSTDGK